MKVYTKLIFLFLSTISLSSYAQKELREALPFKDKITIRRMDGSFQVAELNVKEKVDMAKADRSYFWYLRDSIRHTQGAYKGRLLHGVYQELYPDKSLKVIGTFYKGLKQGEWRYMEPDGTLRRVSTWYGGDETGKYALYDAQGKLQEKGRLQKGLKEGIVINYTQQDSTEKTYIRYKHNQAEEKGVNWFDKVKVFLGF